MEVLDNLQMILIEILAVVLFVLIATLRNERLEHSAHQIELGARGPDAARRSLDLENAAFLVLLAFERRIVLGLLAAVPVGARVLHREQNRLEIVLFLAGCLANYVAQLHLHEVLQIAVGRVVDGLFKRVLEL